jgi:hypothetical protein
MEAISSAARIFVGDEIRSSLLESAMDRFRDPLAATLRLQQLSLKSADWATKRANIFHNRLDVAATSGPERALLVNPRA